MEATWQVAASVVRHVSPPGPSQDLGLSSGSPGFAPKVEFSERLGNKLLQPSLKGEEEPGTWLWSDAVFMLDTSWDL